MITSLSIIKILRKKKSDDDKVTYFYETKIPKVDSNHICLAVINLDSALKKDDNNYLQVFLKEYKYIEKKVIRQINHNFSEFLLMMMMMMSLMKNK